ncbi:YrdB family protein [Rhodocytophaga rosea]
MLTTLGYVGFQSNQSTFWKYLLAVGLPLLVAILWGIFAAPRSVHRLTPLYRALFALGLFSLTALLLYRSGLTRLAVIFGAAALISQSVALVLKQ